ncbi:MFS transporter [Streptomyces sp. NBC_01218]|uniref:MFS transporter n=1 Tax=unclassified Streptomyces TaxID=2593676 RepID=UPI0023B980FC|nr:MULTISPECIES: MFS transporter [unclassified Streptomyces]WEH40466.1 MFS transporter [Streptomyces sp. AM 2-1-1]WSQ52158.1 MFS transporter [Streptomyces sp. NBC_01218]
MDSTTHQDASEATIGHSGRTMTVTAIATFMVSLDQLVVTTALTKIRESLHTGLQGLEWTVNAYTLTFAVFLLTASALAERFGRRRLFMIGIVLFTGASALAALAPSIGVLIAARAIQGLGSAIVLPLSLTLLSAAVPPSKRGAALGVWGGVGGLGVALGPVIGGFITESASWQWIFWLNVPIGIVLLALSFSWLTESHGPVARLDLVGTVLACLGLFGVVVSIIRGDSAGWTSAQTLGTGLGGLALLVAFAVWETRTPHPMLPMRLFSGRAFTTVNLLSLFMFFGMFGSIFLITQYLQTALGYSPFAAGLRFLAWTGVVLIAAPLGGGLSDKIGGKPIIVAGLVLQSVGLLWLALGITTGSSFPDLVPAFLCNGFGMGLYFGPSGNVVMGSVRREEEGIASGANNAIRELGGVFGVAVLAAVFAGQGGYDTKAHYVHGLHAALWVGFVFVALGAVTAMLLPKDRPAPAVAKSEPASGATTDEPERTLVTVE